MIMKIVKHVEDRHLTQMMVTDANSKPNEVLILFYKHANQFYPNFL